MRRVNAGREVAIISAAARYQIISLMLNPLSSFAPRAEYVVFHNCPSTKISTMRNTRERRLPSYRPGYWQCSHASQPGTFAARVRVFDQDGAFEYASMRSYS